MHAFNSLKGNGGSVHACNKLGKKETKIKEFIVSLLLSVAATAAAATAAAAAAACV